MERHVVCMGDEKYIQHFGWRFEGKRTLERYKHRWKDNIKMDHKKRVCKDVG